jgi:hypothetical protein
LGKKEENPSIEGYPLVSFSSSLTKGRLTESDFDDGGIGMTAESDQTKIKCDQEKLESCGKRSNSAEILSRDRREPARIAID